MRNLNKMIKEYLVLSRSNGTTRTGSPYAVLKVADLIETINISVWDLQPTAEPKVGQLVSFYAIKDNAGKKSCSVTDMKPGATGITKVIGCTECTPVPVTGGQLCCTELATHHKGVYSDAQTSRTVC